MKVTIYGLNYTSKRDEPCVSLFATEKARDRMRRWDIRYQLKKYCNSFTTLSQDDKFTAQDIREHIKLGELCDAEDLLHDLQGSASGIGECFEQQLNINPQQSKL